MHTLRIQDPGATAFWITVTVDSPRWATGRRQGAQSAARRGFQYPPRFAARSGVRALPANLTRDMAFERVARLRRLPY